LHQRSDCRRLAFEVEADAENALGQFGQNAGRRHARAGKQGSNSPRGTGSQVVTGATKLANCSTAQA
jgi:hypothetical protein